MKRVAIAMLSLLPQVFTHSVSAEAGSGFKPSFNAGVLMHAYASFQQKGYGSGSEIDKASQWDYDATLYRARIMLEANLSKRDYVFIETDITSPLGTGADKMASIRILDAQWDHTFCPEFVLSAGKMLVSHNRNGLQTASTLMANDFTYFQYPYNMSETSPLQNDCGRDIGVGGRGYSLDGKLGYRLGVFAGRRDWGTDSHGPMRVIGRAEYNFLDRDKYSGTNLGEGKTFTIGGGFDTQGSYMAAGGDMYFDYPLSDAGSVTVNMAYSYITGGNDLTTKYNFVTTIPTQNVYYLEAGYYFKKPKLQPWIKFERQAINSEGNQVLYGMTNSDFDKFMSTTVYGGGLNYFFNGYITNVKLSYTAMKKGGLMDAGDIKNKTYSQIWLQVQLCLF